MQSWEISLFAINNERTALLLNDGTGQVMELSFPVQSKDRSKYVTVETPHGLRSQIGEIGIGYGPPHPTREVYAEMQPK